MVYVESEVLSIFITNVPHKELLGMKKMSSRLLC